MGLDKLGGHDGVGDHFSGVDAQPRQHHQRAGVAGAAAVAGGPVGRGKRPQRQQLQVAFITQTAGEVAQAAEYPQRSRGHLQVDGGHRLEGQILLFLLFVGVLLLGLLREENTNK